MFAQTGPQVMAAVLAGGLGTRIGGDKAMVELAGRPLVGYAVAAARAAGLDVVVVAKRDTRLPILAAPTLTEPDAPRHPFAGVAAALRRHGDVLALPCDMPFVSPELIAALARNPGEAVVGTIDGRLQPFPAVYRRGALAAVEAGLAAEGPVRATLAELAPTLVDARPFGDPERLYLTVNTPADLTRAELLLAG